VERGSLSTPEIQHWGKSAVSRAEYSEIPELKNTYLEDGYLLSVLDSGDVLCFEVELPLLESHEQFSKPLPGEQYCYRVFRFLFQNPRRVDWTDRRFVRIQDLDGSSYFGPISSFCYDAGDSQYELQGSWGKVRIWCGALKIVS
jgi:hypothetical protein